MDFGAVGFDELVGSSTAASCLGSLASDPETKQKLYGSGGNECDFWRSSKLAKTRDDFSNKPLLRSSGSPLFSASEEPHQMLSFSKSEALAATSPYSYLTSSSPYSRNIGYSNSGTCTGGGNMHFGLVTGTKGPFTQSQWIELEHQALIYKYICSNMPIPSNLLQPIRKAFESAGFSGYSDGLLRSNSLGWGGFHLGFSSSTDPEPGRCRRTDGKKWRCSRDAFPDQKYCERHMNRGRHRSRKPVEAPSVPGHSVASSTATSINTASSALSNILPSTVQPTILNRMFMNKDNVTEKVQNLKSKENPFLISMPFQDTPRNEFRPISSDSFVNASLGKPSSLTCLVEQETKSHHPLLEFMDRNQPPISSISLNRNDNATLSPLRLSRMLDPVQMGLGVGVDEEQDNRRVSWIGGPLGEVLNKNITKTGSGDHKVSSGFDLLAEAWDRSTQSSPTGVLQRTTFISLSNSSTGSSPRTENHINNNINFNNNYS